MRALAFNRLVWEYRMLNSVFASAPSVYSLQFLIGFELGFQGSGFLDLVPLWKAVQAPPGPSRDTQGNAPNPKPETLNPKPLYNRKTETLTPKT